MKTTNKLLAILLVCVSFFVVSCEKDVTREPSPETNPNSNNVYFPQQTSKPIAIGIDEDKFDVLIVRDKFEKALTVNVKITGNKAFSCPDIVKFDAGDKDTVLTLSIGKIELMKKYLVTLAIDESQTNPYDTLYNKSKFAILSMNVLREDFVPYAQGTYKSLFFKESWDATLEYSPATQLYRFKNCWTTGYDVTFKWKDSEVKVQGTFTKDKKYVYLPTGYLHPKYGMVNAYYPQEDINYYDKDTKTFTFPIEWMVSAGTFGVKEDTYTITKEEVINK